MNPSASTSHRTLQSFDAHGFILSSKSYSASISLNLLKLPLQKFKALLIYSRLSEWNTQDEQRTEDKLDAITDIWQDLPARARNIWVVLVLQFWKSYIAKADITLDARLVSLSCGCLSLARNPISPAKVTKENMRTLVDRGGRISSHRKTFVI